VLLLVASPWSWCAYYPSGCRSWASVIQAVGCHHELWIGRLCSVGAFFLLVVSSNSVPGGVSTHPPFPCEVSSPCTALDIGMWKPRYAFKCGFISIEMKIILFGEPSFAPLPPPLVPSSLAKPLNGWWQRSVRRSYERWCRGAMATVYPTSMLFWWWLPSWSDGCLSSWCPSLVYWTCCVLSGRSRCCVMFGLL
jgi:hypothetical protein